MEIFLKIFVTVSWLMMIQAAPRQKRLTLAEKMPSYYYSNIGGNPNVYEFGYDVSDSATGNNQFRSEQRHPNGTVTGHYGYVDPSGIPRKYKYIADEGGYRVFSDRATTGPPPPKPFYSTEHVDPSISWTRPPKKPNKNQILSSNNFVTAFANVVQSLISHETNPFINHNN
ncbi:unnamed protein product [Arctia plantaginis]|uniref:Uncharacterized protein n=1 Tax=Arctia plantaginis TaxID=874455 RepID=A0A8S1AEQ5_ARCPL|nr:unnamed protein product [Arctia plantaginis]